MAWTSEHTALVLCACFALSSWIAINGIYAELPLIVDAVPESWAIASYLAVAVQLANIAPIAYAVVLSRTRSDGARRKLVVGTIVAVLVLGIACLLMLALLWAQTSEIGGSDHSTALIGLTFGLSVVDCTTTLVRPFPLILYPDSQSYVVLAGLLAVCGLVQELTLCHCPCDWGKP